MTQETQEPKPFDRRVVESRSGNGRPYYEVHQFRVCGCPHCEDGGHWRWEGGYLDKAQAQQAAER